MIDVRRTLENLHQILPNLSIEDLFRVLDNIVEIPQFNVGQTTKPELSLITRLGLYYINLLCINFNYLSRIVRQVKYFITLVKCRSCILQ